MKTRSLLALLASLIFGVYVVESVKQCPSITLKIVVGIDPSLLKPR